MSSTKRAYCSGLMVRTSSSASCATTSSASLRASSPLATNDSDSGPQISKGTSLSGDAKEKAEAGYFDLIRDHVAEYWALPEWLRRQKLTAQIQIRIDPAGRILSSKFLKSSGNPQFDEAILGTLKDSEPLPRPPKELISSLADDGVVFGFPL